MSNRNAAPIISDIHRRIVRLVRGEEQSTVGEIDEALEYARSAYDAAADELSSIEQRHDDIYAEGDPGEIGKYEEKLKTAKTNAETAAARLRKANDFRTTAVERERAAQLNALEALGRKLSDEGVAGLNDYVAACEKQIVPIFTRQAEIDGALREINRELAAAGRPTIPNPGERVNERPDIPYTRPERHAHLPNPIDMAHPFWSHGRRQ